MKKKTTVVASILLAIMTLVFAGCGSNVVIDNDYAFAEITTGTEANIVSAIHMKNAYYEGRREIAAIENPTIVPAKKGDKVSIHFHCGQCGYDEVVELEAPFSRLFCCECQGTIEDGKIKEYIAVSSGEIDVNDKE